MSSKPFAASRRVDGLATCPPVPSSARGPQRIDPARLYVVGRGALRHLTLSIPLGAKKGRSPASLCAPRLSGTPCPCRFPAVSSSSPRSSCLRVGFLTLLGIVGMTIWLGERSQVYFDEVIEARDTRGAAVELRSALQTAESSQRGFLVTGNEIYLAPYDSAKAQARRQLETLNAALAPYPRDRARCCGGSPTWWPRRFAEMDQTHRAEDATARRRGAGAASAPIAARR